MSNRQHEDPSTEYDAVVVGAGFGGLRMLQELRKLGVSARLLEAGSDVGGTWYWNRYPGARTDCESWVYAMNFSQDLLQEWDWSQRYAPQDEVQRYLRHVAERFDLLSDIQFDTWVDSATYDEDRNRWTVRAGGQSFTCTYLIWATGLLSAHYVPQIEGLDTFQGEMYFTARWPEDPVDLEGKCVGVIGTGSTGIQVIPEIAPVAGHVTVFQRTPNYVLPARNHPIDPGQRAAIKRDYDEIWAASRRHVFGLPMKASGLVGAKLTPEELTRALKAGWETGGFHFIFEVFDDLTTNPATNEAACEFIRENIRAIVKDPSTAELLCPKGYPLGAKRPPLGHFYYEAFNRDNVSLVDVSGSPIATITRSGVQTASTHYDCDVLIIATGFDAGTGALMRIEVTGRDGQTLAEKWQDGPKTYLGLAVDEFPNMFLISGPQSSFSNIPLVVDYSSRWIVRAITRSRRDGETPLEPTPEAVEAWGEKVNDVMRRPTVIAQGAHARSWQVGANVPGKAQVALFHLAGYAAYAADCERATADDFAEFTRAVRRGPYNEVGDHGGSWHR